MLTETENLKPLTQYGEKYWVSRDGEVFRMRRDGVLFPISTCGAPPRVRLYYNGKETRPYVKYVILQTWGIGPAQEFEQKFG